MFVSAGSGGFSGDRGSRFNQRRPSFPQGGLDWRLRHKAHHDNNSHNPQQRRKTVSVCVLPESDEEDEDGQSPERMPQHERSCPLYQPDPGTTNASAEQILDNGSDKAKQNVAPHSTTTTITTSSPCLLQPPPTVPNLLKPQCNCSFREAIKGRNNNNNNDDDPNNHSGGGSHRRGGRGRRKKKRKNRRETVIINVGGQVFETYRSTLKRLRTPVFHSDETMELYYRKSHGDYFFDRDAGAFGSILNFLRTGELHIPTNMCGPALQNELEFWGIEEIDIARCCWTQYNTWKTQCRSLEKLEYDRKFSTTQQVNTVDPDSSCWNRYRSKIWTFLQDPGSSRKAKIYAWISILFVFISIFSFCAETHPMFRVKARDMTHFASFYEFFNLESIQWSKLTVPKNETLSKNSTLKAGNGSPFNSNLTLVNSSDLNATPVHNISGQISKIAGSGSVGGGGSGSDGIKKRGTTRHNNNDYYDNNENADNDYAAYNDYEETTDEVEIEGKKDLPHPALLMMDISCLIFFTVEYVTRFVCSPSKLDFLRALQNVVDFLAFAPDYVELLFLIIDPHQSEGMAIMEMLFILRILRLFRIFRLIRHVPGLWILLYTLKASFNELMLMCVFLLIGMVVFATLIHFLEPDGTFTNIPVGFWWSVVTMTTVGYGDMVPQSAAGYFIGSCCAVAGLLMIAFTVPIIVSNFVLYYTHVQYGLARRDREMELIKEEEESELGRSRSHLDIERAGSTSSVTPLQTSRQQLTGPASTTTRNGKSYTYVYNKSDTETSPMAPISHAGGESDGQITAIELGENVTHSNVPRHPHTVLTLEGHQIA